MRLKRRPDRFMGSSFKFLHAADVHLDSPLRGLERYEGAPVTRLRGASRRAFEKLAQLAIDEGVAFVVLAGDLYDGDWKDYNTGLFFTKVMRDLREAGIPVYLLAGNHDAASQITRSLRLPDNVHVFATDRPQSFEIEALGVAVHGQGFASRVVNENLARGYPEGAPDRFDVGVLHTSLDGRAGRDHAPYAPCSLDDLKSKGYEYWALGHVHQRQVVAESPWIAFSGNLQGRHARESGEKGALLVSVNDHVVEEVAFRPLDVVRWHRLPVDLAGARDAEEALDRVREAVQELMDARDDHLIALRLELVGPTAAHAALHRDREAFDLECRNLALDIGGEDLWLEKIVRDTKPVVALEAALERDDAFGGLLRAIHALEESDAIEAALEDTWSELRKKLPPEVAADVIDPEDTTSRGDLLEDVKQSLISRLLDHEATS